MSLASGYKDYIFYADGVALPGLRFDFTATTPGNSYIKIYYRINEGSFIEASDATWYDISDTTGWVVVRAKVEMYIDGSGNEPTLDSFQIQSRNFGGFLGDAVKFTDDAGGDETFLQYSFTDADQWTLQMYVQMTDITSGRCLFALHNSVDDETLRLANVSSSGTTLQVTEVISSTTANTNTATAGDSFNTDFALITFVYDGISLSIYQNDEEVLSILSSAYTSLGSYDELYIGKDPSSHATPLDPLIGYASDYRKYDARASLDETIQHVQEAMPWKDPTSARNANGSVVIDAGGIRLRKAEISQIDKHGRSIDIGSYGILSRDASGNILHDIAQSSDISPYKFFGHYYHKGVVNPVVTTDSLLEGDDTETFVLRNKTYTFTLNEIFAADSTAVPDNVKGFKISSSVNISVSDAKTIAGTYCQYSFSDDNSTYYELVKGLSQDSDFAVSSTTTYDLLLDSNGDLSIYSSAAVAGMGSSSGTYSVVVTIYIVGYYA